MNQRFVKGDKIRNTDGTAFSNGKEFAIVERVDELPSCQKLWLDTGKFATSVYVELVERASSVVATVIDQLNLLYKEKQEELDNIKVAIKTLEKLEGENK